MKGPVSSSNLKTGTTSGTARLAVRRILCSGLAALALAGVIRVSGQQNTLAPQTNDVQQAEEMTAAGDNALGDDLTTGDEMVDTNSVALTNNPAAGPGEDARSRRLRRQRLSRPRSYGQANGNTSAGPSATNAGPASLDYSAFRLVAERNIFDPNRFPHAATERIQPKTVDSFGLVGTMSYEKGDFAFFDGPSADYKKVLKASDTIAGYKVVAVLADSVKLARATNELELAVGSQMRRRDDGTWVQVAGAPAYEASPSAASSSPPAAAASSGAESDIIKRMMQRREKE